MKKVAVIILNYKVKREALKAVNSVLTNGFSDFQILVVDNNSNDGIETDLLNINKVKFIQTYANLGYTGGNNLGIKDILNSPCEYILILNPDATIKKDTIKFLIEAIESEGADIVGPKILFGDKKTIWYAGGTIDFDNVIGLHRGLDERDNNQYDISQETDFVTGAAFFAKKEVFEKVGLFDERYFLYMEDVDLCFRARKMGMKIIYQPKAVVFHSNAKATKLGSPLQDYYLTRNRLLFAFKFLSWRIRFALLRHVFANINIPARRKALIDFLLGRFGKGPY